MDLVGEILIYLAALFILMIGIAILLAGIVYIRDITQTDSAIHRNFPVIGHLRGLFSHLGEFFRQYFFAMDREEMPFNRAQRDWVERASEHKDNTVPLGSTRVLSEEGTITFANAPYADLSADTSEAEAMVIGQGTPNPYEAPSFFNISAMSYGALSRPAVRALSLGAAQAGCWLNTGEGGLSPWHEEGGCDVVFQIGTAKYGVRGPDGALDDDKLKALSAKPHVKMVEIKLAQGAKPGKGGILPGAKVTEEVADIRGIAVGQDSISPNRFPEVANDDELLNFINHVRSVSGRPTGIKIVLGDPAWIDGFCDLINRRGEETAPDFITVDSADGGTGAAPLPLMDYMGLQIQESLPAVVDSLIRHGLRDRVRVIASGKLITPGPVAWALAMGADFVNNARGFMFALGCIQAMKCNRNTCPTGVTTHDKRLQRGLDPADKADRVAGYVEDIRNQVGMIAHSCGVHDPRQLRRKHARMLLNARTVSLEELYPTPEAA